MLVALGVLLWSLTVPGTARAFLWSQGLWWQQEIPPPGPNQIINPDYLTKKQELNESWNQLNRQNNTSRQLERWTFQNHVGDLSDNRALNKSSLLERELKETPMYVEQGAPPAPGPEPAGEVLIKY